MADAVWDLAAKAANLLSNLSSSITPTEGGAIAPFFVCWGKLRSMLQPGVPPTVTGAVRASLHHSLTAHELLAGRWSHHWQQCYVKRTIWE